GRQAAVVGQRVVALSPGREPLVGVVHAHREVGPRQSLPGERPVALDLPAWLMLRPRTPRSPRDVLLVQCVAEPSPDGLVDLLAAFVREVGDHRLPGGQDVRGVMIGVGEPFLNRTGWANADALAPTAGDEALPVRLEEFLLERVARGGVTVAERGQH